MQHPQRGGRSYDVMFMTWLSVVCTHILKIGLAKVQCNKGSENVALTSIIKFFRIYIKNQKVFLTMKYIL